MLEQTDLAKPTVETERIQNLGTISSAEMERKQPVDERQSVLQLPSDFPKTPSTTYIPDYHVFSLPAPLVEALDARSQLENVDSRSLLLAAFQTLLYRYTLQETIQLGLVIPSRSIERNSITELATQISGELKLRALVNESSEVLLSERSQIKEQLNQPAKLSILLTMLDKSSGLEEEKQWIAEFKPKNQLQKLDLHLVILQQQPSISGIFEYNANLFEASTIERLSGHFQVVLEAMADDLDRPIAQFPLLTEAEQHQLLVEWNSATANYPQIPIYQHIEAHAAQYPDAIALKFKEEQLTYAQLNQRANQLAHYLRSVGVGAEERVAVCVQPSLEIAVSLLGILKAGGVYVPLDPTFPQERLRAILEDTQAKVLFTQAHLLPNLPAIAKRCCFQQIAQQSICLDRDWEIIDRFPAHNRETEIDLDQTAYIIYTSGTTGKPKGVMATHRNLINYILATQEQFGFNRHDVMPSIARYTFSISLFELLSPLVAGGTLVLLEREQVLDFPRMVQTLEQLTMIHTVPSLMQRLVAYIKDKGLELQKFQGVKHVFTGGDMVPPDLLESLKNVFGNANVCVLYGCSEVSSLCANYPVPREQIVTKSRVGKPFNNVRIRLYDSHQNLVPIGVPGEIYVGGAGVTKGYLHRDDLTQEKFIAIDGQRFYRTGDLGRLGADGNIEFLGRADFQIKLRGIRIELGDIEGTLRQAPGVREGVVMARELGSGEPGLVAYVVLNREHNPTIESIRDFLQAKLPDYMVPAAFVVLDAMPLNPNQKVDRRALPMPTSENLVGFKMFVPPRNELERQLTQIWEEVLGIEPIGIQNNFFELGGNSLLAVQMLAEVEKQCGKNLPITTLLSSPTIEELAKVLCSLEEHTMVGDLVPLRRTGTKPPLFCIYGILLYQDLVNQLDSNQPVYGVYLQEEVELIKTGNVDLHNSIFSSVETIAARYLQAIRTLQPHGPYYLAGESFGGVVAFEMAQQLQAAGEEVALVALFDSLAPNSLARMPLVQRLKLHGQLLLKQGLPYLLEKAQPLINSLQQKFLTRTNKDSQPSEDILQTDTEKAPQDIRQEVRQRTSRLYFPQPYSGKMVLFYALERDAFEGEGDRDLGWKSVAAGGLQIYDVPGDHLGILKHPNVRVLADKLQLHLN
jgi:amino acid adenylation domain-containing protein